MARLAKLLQIGLRHADRLKQRHLAGRLALGQKAFGGAYLLRIEFDPAVAQLEQRRVVGGQRLEVWPG
jgi:hypothetical protein